MIYQTFKQKKFKKKEKKNRVDKFNRDDMS